MGPMILSTPRSLAQAQAACRSVARGLSIVEQFKHAEVGHIFAMKLIVPMVQYGGGADRLADLAGL